MGSRKMDLRTPPRSRHKTIEQIYNAAFSPSVALYRQISLCGWRPLDPFENWTRLGKETPKIGIEQKDAQAPSDIQIQETSNGITITVFLANIKEESLHLAIAGEMVIIRGERILHKAGIASKSFSARSLPEFQHNIKLPATVSTGGFRAQLKGDVVQIDFAKRH